MRCSYKYCFCEDNEEMVKNGTWKYHQECLDTKNDIAEIAQLFQEKINSNVVYPQLYGVINNIVFQKGVTTKFLKFGLEYYIDHRIKLNYPAGLYYILQNREVQNAWDKAQVVKIKQKMKENVDDDMALLESDFTYKPTKQKTIGDIFNE